MTGSGAPHDRRRLPMLRTAITAVLLAAAIAALLLLGPNAGHRAAAPLDTSTATPAGLARGAGAFAPAEATIDAREPETDIPASFLGFSTEYWTLPTDATHIALYRRVVQLVQIRDDGRFVLRIGGNSSDHAFWDPTRRPLPHWAFAVTPGWVTRTARVVRRLHLRVIIDLNTVTSTPRLAADWADAAVDRLPRGSIIGFEIGNEPDVYARDFWIYRLGGATFDAGLLPKAITARSYVSDYDAYARALATAAPDIPLLGPALANPRRDVGWISTLLSRPHPRLGEITVHKYPYTACARPGRRAFPTVGKLLSDAASAGAVQTIRPAVAIGRLAGYEVRVTELNSVGCGGVAGVSNTFATALWAPDTLFELAQAGVEGVELHVRLYSINAPFRFYGRGVLARPLLYGLILFKRMLGPDSRLVPVRLRSAAILHLKAWAVRVSRDTLNVLLIDKGPHSIAVRLRLPSTSPGRMQRLLAPSGAAQTGVTLAGQHLGRAVTWQGRRQVQTIAPRGGEYLVRMRRQSAAMLTVRVAPSTLAS